jgi:hypothetical protein
LSFDFVQTLSLSGTFFECRVIQGRNIFNPRGGLCI